VQNAKDTFYEVLRGRLAGLNPERTAVVRGVTRPGLVVAENELSSATAILDCFVMRWTEATWDGAGAMPVVTLRCEIGYGTAGSAERGGMDRGRALAAMDAELMSALGEEPRSATKMNYSEGGAPMTMSTRVWWSEAELSEAKAAGDRLQRTAAVAVMSFEEAGEL
jgi:hypothetical protein